MATQNTLYNLTQPSVIRWHTLPSQIVNNDGINPVVADYQNTTNNAFRIMTEAVVNIDLLDDTNKQAIYLPTAGRTVDTKIYFCNNQYRENQIQSNTLQYANSTTAYPTVFGATKNNRTITFAAAPEKSIVYDIVLWDANDLSNTSLIWDYTIENLQINRTYRTITQDEYEKYVSGEYVSVYSINAYVGDEGSRAYAGGSNYYYSNPVFLERWDSCQVAEVVNGNFTNNMTTINNNFYKIYTLFNLIKTNNESYLIGPHNDWRLMPNCFKTDDAVGWARFSNQGTAALLIKREALIRYLNYIGLPFVLRYYDAGLSEDIQKPVDQLPDYNPNATWEDLVGPPTGQPDNEAGGGDGTGDNTEDNFDLPTPSINPASAAVNQYVLSSKQVYSFMEELFNGTFWTNSDLLNKNPKESVVSLTAWPINLLNWDTRNVGIPEPIVCGNVTMKYASGQPIQNGYNKVVDIGEYEIKPYFGSFMDYLTKIEIFLPFIGWRNLSTQNVMGRTIKVKYVLNFEDGGVVVYITSTDGKIERLEQVEQAKLAFDLPIFTSNINEKEKEKLQLLMTAAVSAATAGFGALGSGVGKVAATTASVAGKEVASGASKINSFQDSINGGSVVASNATWYLPNKCILKFTRPRKSVPSGYGRVNGYPANYTAKLGDVKGYTEVENPILNGIECTENERAQIKTLLQGGIYL